MIPLTGNFFFQGVVEDVDDPDQLGRVRVRIIGIHKDDKSLIPTNKLPWADVAMPVTSAGISGVGTAPVGLVQGSMVMGIFKDGSDFQEPIVLWSLGGKRTKNKNSTFGFNGPDGIYPLVGYDQDINFLAGGKDLKGKPQTARADGMRMRADNGVAEKRVDDNPVVPDSTGAAMGSTPWMGIASGEVGTNEEKNAAKIKEYHKIGGGASHNETVAWCASFIGYCLDKGGMIGTKSAMARSYLKYGKDVGTTNIPYGAIGVLQGNRGPASGHVVFITKDLGSKIEVIGGNQTTSLEGGKAVKYDTGGQVTKITFPKSKLVGCRMPTEDKKKTG